MIEYPVNIVDRTIHSILAMDNKDKIELITNCKHDLAYYAVLAMPHILMENLDPEQKRLFEQNKLDREVFMPNYQVDLYKNYSDMFAGTINYMCNVLFRGAAKTTIKNIAVTNAIGFGVYRCIVYISETKEQASRDAAKVVDEILHNQIFKLLFGKVELLVDNAFTKIFYVHNLKKRIALFCTGMNGRIRGINDLGARPDGVFVDDFESETNSNTPEGRNKVQIKINSQILNMTDYEYDIAWQGTIIDPDSFLANAKTLPMFTGDKGRYYEKKWSESESIVYDKLRDRFVVKNPHDFHIGNPAWPARYPDWKIKEKYEHFKHFKGGTQFWQFFQEFYNIPKSDVDAPFDASKITEADCEFRCVADIPHLVFKSGTQEQRKVLVYTYYGQDPAAGREIVNDNTVGMTIAVMPNGHIVIIDILCGKVSLKKQIDLPFDKHDQFKYTRGTIESYGMALAIYDQIMDETYLRNKFIDLSKYNRSKQSKSDKLKSGLESYINAGMISYMKGCPNIQVFLTEVACFQRGDEHDDTIDALFLAVLAYNGFKPIEGNVDEMINIRRKSQSTFAKQTGQNRKVRFCDSWRNL